MVEIGSGAQRPLTTVMMSRYACCVAWRFWKNCGSRKRRSPSLSTSGVWMRKVSDALAPRQRRAFRQHRTQVVKVSFDIAHTLPPRR
jgi:hypothetical protein